MLVAIVAFYAGLCGLIAMTLSAVVVGRRFRNKVDLGTGNNSAVEQAIRAHGNFSEYVPLILMLLLLLALAGVSAYWLHALGIALVISRLLHAQGLLSSRGATPGRFLGINLTWIVLVVASIRAIIFGVTSFLL
jgi:uncharacterized membrane protein YecN with MAPEG domain